MQTNHEINALVAEHIFGYRNNGSSYSQYLLDTSLFTDAWAIVEKLTRTDVCCFDLSFSASEGWICSMRLLLGDHDKPFIERGSTAPEAICLAALKAKGVEL
jgi:hypothetical protein